jgi:acyl-CoA thioester hydrolase
MRRQGEISAEIEVEVPFHDVDLARVVWHGHYLKYFENARWLLMDLIGYGLQSMLDSGYGWPVVDLQVKYLRVSRYGERLRVRASLLEWENRLVINYLVTDVATGERVARGQTVQATVEMATGTLQFVMPEEFLAAVRAKLGAPAGLKAASEAGARD